MRRRLNKVIAVFVLAVVIGATLGLATAAAQEFSVEGFNVTYNNADGSLATQAGSHPFSLTTAFEVASVIEGEKGVIPSGALKDLRVALPPGVVGDVKAVPQCGGAEFTDFSRLGESPLLPACSVNSAVGVVATKLSFISSLEPPQYFSAPVYSLVPPKGVAAMLGFIATGGLPITVELRVSESAPYNVIATLNDVPQAARFFGSVLTVWGNPSDPAHAPFRGACLDREHAGPQPEFLSNGSCSSSGASRAFLTLPVSCSAPQSATAEANTWENPGLEAFATAASGLSATGCSRLAFEPSIAAAPTTNQGESASGLDFNIDFHDEGLSNPNAIAQSDINKAVVTLPEGMTLNPSAATGLTSCSEGALGQETSSSQPGEGCPESSKVGSVEVETPLLEGSVLHGSLYVATPFQNPFNSLLAVYMVIKDPQLGISIKLPGRVVPDERTGRLVTTFGEPPYEVPQFPFSHFNFHFREGQRAPLTTPQNCGTQVASVQFTPWSNPEAPVTSNASFSINSGPGGSSCLPAGGAALHPTFSAGTVAPVASAYSPFVFNLKREGGQQQLQSIDTTLPKGLLGRLAGVTECSDADVAAAAARNQAGQGAAEVSNPSCPASSQVGTVTVGAGSGTPTYVQGKVYLAGPYKGAPLSLAIITPAIAGPFDLGNVVVRTALYVEPFSTQIHAVSDAIPSILAGIPLDVRSIALNLDRSEFTRNPTSCDPMEVLAGATSLLGQTSPLSSRFQVGGCRGLDFRPTLKLSLKGATRRTGHPALKAVVTYPKGGSYANIARAQVNLPHSIFLEQNNLNKTCTRPVLLEGKCPRSSIYGKAKAWSPLLEKPLQGNVYLVGGFGYKLPALVAELNGQIRVLLKGKVDSGPNKGIRNTFEAVPDAPVSRFVLELKGGPKYSLLINSENLCAKPQKAIARFTAQNGAVLQTKPVISRSCGKKAKGGGKKKSGSSKGKKQGK